MIQTALLYLLAQLEVHWAILTRKFDGEDPRIDYLPASLVPSVSQGDSADRDLAEIDQDGFVFAIDPRDEAVFHSRSRMVPRRDNRLQLVLRNGNILVRKTPLPPRGKISLAHRIPLWVKLGFYLECASLFRLRGLRFVPRLRHVDLRNGAIEMDYIWGVDLRHLLADGAETIDYLKISRRFTSLLDRPQDWLSAEIAELIGDVARKGVMHRDLTAANFVRGKDTGRLYVIDFNFVYLRPAPGWWAHADRLSSTLAEHWSRKRVRPLF